MARLMQQLPLGRSGFAALRQANAVYVDKTAMIAALAQNDGKLFFTRPRRFGKSLLVSTLESLFAHGLRDFKGLAIESLWTDTTYRVVRLDFSEIKHFRTIEGFSEQFSAHIVACFAKVGFRAETTGSVIAQLSSWLADLGPRSIVVLIDEYDAPMTACLDAPELFSDVRMTLSRFFSVLKSKDDCLRFLWMTGVTKFSSTSIFSEFNDMNDISLNADFGTLVGYTESEIEIYFSDYLQQAAAALQLSADEVLEQLRAHYNGFCFDSQAHTRVYCPWSVLSFLKNPQQGFGNYWYASGGHPAVLLQYLKGHDLDDPACYAEPKKVALSDLIKRIPVL